MRPVHVIIPTHTTRHLRLTLMGIAHQSNPAASVTITCDNDDEDIRSLVADIACEFGMSLMLVQRQHQKQERLAQVRNNAVRAIIGHFPDVPGLNAQQMEDDPQLLFLDGDCFLERDGIMKHSRLAAHAELVIAFRTDTSEEQLAAFDEAKAARGEMPIAISASQRQLLRRRHQRYRRQQRLKSLPLAGRLLVKNHKPKLLGGHHSIRLSSYLKVNGHDELYNTWGTEDDDFCGRVYKIGTRSVIAVQDIGCLHLYHATRNPGDWHARANAERFAQRGTLPTICEHGVRNSLEQPTPKVTKFDG